MSTGKRRGIEIVRAIRDGLLTIAYPEQCRLCQEPVDSWSDGVACSRCWDDPAITTLLSGVRVCWKCGAPEQDPTRPSNLHEALSSRLDRATPLSRAAQPRGLCGACNGLSFDAARACGMYSGAIEASVIFLKSRPHICPRLRRILIDTFLNHHEALDSETVIPVPLHGARQRERGFNQATVIAKTLAGEFAIQIDAESLARVKHTERHRAGMDALDRYRSVAEAFKITRPEAIKGVRVLLVDDLSTTGSTVSAAATALLEAGARRVNVLTLARAAGSRSR